MLLARPLLLSRVSLGCAFLGWVFLGCGRVTDDDGDGLGGASAVDGAGGHLGISSPKVHEEHGAPTEASGCPRAKNVRSGWTASFPAPGLEKTGAGNVAVATDPCGNFVVAWDEIAPEDASGESFPTVARLFPEGSKDWTRMFGRSKADPGFTGDPVYLRDLQLDASGNLILLTNDWLQALAPNGGPYPGMPEPLTEAGGLFARSVSSGWLVVAGGYSVFALPEGDLLSFTQGQGLTAEPDERSGFWLLDDRKYLVAMQSKGLTGAPPEEGYERAVVEIRVPAPDDDGYSRSETTSLLNERSELRTAGGQVAVVGERTIYAFAEVEPETHSCERSVVVDINDPSWRPELDICGTPMSLLGAPDGRLLALWAVTNDAGEEPVTMATPTLIVSDTDGTSTSVLDLSDELGLVEAPVFGLPKSLSMTLSEDGKKVLVAGAARNALEVRLALLELDSP